MKRHGVKLKYFRVGVGDEIESEKNSKQLFLGLFMFSGDMIGLNFFEGFNFKGTSKKLIRLFNFNKK